MNKKLKTIILYIVEFGKWILVIWLLYPALYVNTGKPLNPYRFIGGLTLFIIFLGKTFYDIVLRKMYFKKEKTTRQEIFSIIGTVILLALAVALVIFLIGFLIYRNLGDIVNPE